MNVFFKKRNKIFYEKNRQELEFELLNLLRKRFNAYVQFKSGQLKQTHVLKRIRREISRTKFYLFNKNK